MPRRGRARVKPTRAKRSGRGISERPRQTKHHSRREIKAERKKSAHPDAGGRSHPSFLKTGRNIAANESEKPEKDKEGSLEKTSTEYFNRLQGGEAGTTPASRLQTGAGKTSLWGCAKSHPSKRQGEAFFIEKKRGFEKK